MVTLGLLSPECVCLCERWSCFQTSGVGTLVWFGWMFWLYLPGATRVYLTICCSYCCSHKSATTLTIRPDYCPSAVTCRRWPVIFLFFCLITKTAKQAKCVGCLSASLALLDYLTLLTPTQFPARTCTIFRCTVQILKRSSAVDLVLVLEQNGVKYLLRLQVTLLSFIINPNHVHKTTMWRAGLFRGLISLFFIKLCLLSFP